MTQDTTSASAPQEQTAQAKAPRKRRTYDEILDAKRAELAARKRAIADEERELAQLEKARAQKEQAKARKDRTRGLIQLGLLYCDYLSTPDQIALCARLITAIENRRAGALEDRDTKAINDADAILPLLRTAKAKAEAALEAQKKSASPQTDA